MKGEKYIGVIAKKGLSNNEESSFINSGNNKRELFVNSKLNLSKFKSFLERNYQKFFVGFVKLISLV
tara:strand:- start:589 stop:789 length:201 start_codon:yes stop_codon:yes gene_type:complete